MSARVIPLESTGGVTAVLEELRAGIAAGRIRAVVFVTADADGGLGPWWGASKTLGPHAGTMLRGMVAYVGALMDSAALKTSE